MQRHLTALGDTHDPVTSLASQIDFHPTAPQQEALTQLMRWIDGEQDSRRITDPDLAAVFQDNPNDYFVLQGFAGTGKTYLVSYLLTVLHDLTYNVAVAAPTNKAVSVLNDKVSEFTNGALLRAEFASIHSFVGLRMTEGEDGEYRVVSSGYGRLNNFHFAIVDECSMVDRFALLREIQAQRGYCRIIFVGDPAQLPPVGEAREALVFGLPHTYQLTEITRQAAGNPLILASMKIREKIAAGERVEASDLANWLPDAMIKGTKNMVARAVELQRSGKDARILAYRNKTVVSYNELIHYELYPDAKDLFSAGERVVIQNSSPSLDLGTGTTRELRTSEELTVVSIRSERHEKYSDTSAWAVVLRDDLGNELLVYVPKAMSHFGSKASKLFAEASEYKRTNHPDYKDQLAKAWAFKKAFCDIRHTYASTVHKSQGSTYDIALIDLGDIQGMQSVFEMNRSLYVAMTRPRETCSIAY